MSVMLMASASAFNIAATTTPRSRALWMASPEPEKEGQWLVWRRRFGSVWRRDQPIVPEETIEGVKDLLVAERSITVPKQRTGTSYLPEETVERAKAGSKFEKIKLAKDTTQIFTDLYDYAAKIRAGELDWKDVEDADLNTRIKWTGMLHRAKKNPGTFMTRC